MKLKEIAEMSKSDYSQARQELMVRIENRNNSNYLSLGIYWSGLKGMFSHSQQKPEQVPVLVEYCCYNRTQTKHLYL